MASDQYSGFDRYEGLFGLHHYGWISQGICARCGAKMPWPIDQQCPVAVEGQRQASKMYARCWAD